MTRLPSLRRDQLDPLQAELWDAICTTRAGTLQLVDDDGGLIGPFNAFVRHPDVGHRLSALGAHLRFATSIERRVSEVVICTVGAHWASNFEFWAHAPMAIEHGVDPDVLDSLRDGRAPAFERDDERLAHAIAAQLLVDRRVDADTYAAAVDVFGEAGMIELVALIGYYCTISLLLNLFEVGLPQGAPLPFGD